MHYAAALQGTTNGANQMYNILVDADGDEHVVDMVGTTNKSTVDTCSQGHDY